MHTHYWRAPLCDRLLSCNKIVIKKIPCVRGGDWRFNCSLYQTLFNDMENIFSRYKTIKTVDLGIEQDRTENILWRVNDRVLPKSVKSVVIHCGTNNIDTSNSSEISLGIFDPSPIVTQMSWLLLVDYYLFN